MVDCQFMYKIDDHENMNIVAICINDEAISDATLPKYDVILLYYTLRGHTYTRNSAVKQPGVNTSDVVITSYVKAGYVKIPNDFKTFILSEGTIPIEFDKNEFNIDLSKKFNDANYWGGKSRRKNNSRKRRTKRRKGGRKGRRNKSRK